MRMRVMHKISYNNRLATSSTTFTHFRTNMKTAFVLLASLGFLTGFSALGVPKVDYNQFAKSLEKKLLVIPSDAVDGK